jgi:hypothetical protein
MGKTSALGRVWNNIKKGRVSGSAKLFPSFLLFFTKLVVAHHNIVSVFDCITGRWSAPPSKKSFWNPSGSTLEQKSSGKSHHFVFEAPVLSIFRSKMDHEAGAYEIAVVLKNNTIRILVGLESRTSDLKIELSTAKLEIPGYIDQICMDTETTENGRCAFFLIDKNRSYNPDTRVNTDMSKKKRRQTMGL